MLYRLAPFVFAVLLLSGCQKASKLGNVTLGEYSPDIAFPLVNASVKAGDLLESFADGTIIEEGSDGSLTFVYSSDGFGLKSKEVANLIPDFGFPMVDSVMKIPYNLPNNTFVNFVEVKSGYIKIGALNNQGEPITFSLTIVDLSFNGTPFNFSTTIGYPGGILDSVSVPGYVLTPNADSLEFYYQARLVSDNSPVELSNVGVEFKRMRYSYAEGYLGNGNIPIPRDTIEIDLFDQFSGNVFFEEPSITVTVSNSFGFEMKGKFNVLNAHLIDGTVLPLTNSVLNNGFLVDYPTFAEVGQTKQTVFIVDYTNSNINSIIGQPIDFFDYKLNAQANPNSTNQIGFVTDSSEVTLDILVELPIYGTAEQFTISDTLAIGLQLYEKMDYANLKIITDNGFPVDASTQIYFLDNNYDVLDSLSSGPNESFMAAAPVDASGLVTDVNRKITEFEISEEKFSLLKQSGKHIRLKTTFSTTNNGQQSVRIYSDYELGVKIGIVAGIRPLE